MSDTGDKMDKILGSGKTLDAAINDALQKTGYTREQIDYTVLTVGGFLRKFKVEISKKLTEGDLYQNYIDTVLKKAGLDLSVTKEETEEEVKIDIEGADYSTVIGRKGDVLDALQFLASISLGKDAKKRLFVDCKNYRERRQKTLLKLAANLEQKVIRTGRRVKLEPMNAYERRVLHTALKNSQNVVTHSEGNEPFRFVVIEPSEHLAEEIKNRKPQRTQKQETSNDVNGGKRKQLHFAYRTKPKRPSF